MSTDRAAAVFNDCDGTPGSSLWRRTTRTLRVRVCLGAGDESTILSAALSQSPRALRRALPPAFSLSLTLTVLPAGIENLARPIVLVAPFFARLALRLTASISLPLQVLMPVHVSSIFPAPPPPTRMTDLSSDTLPVGAFRSSCVFLADASSLSLWAVVASCC